jgi:hypothetical protein
MSVTHFHTTFNVAKFKSSLMTSYVTLMNPCLAALKHAKLVNGYKV